MSFCCLISTEARRPIRDGNEWEKEDRRVKPRKRHLKNKINQHTVVLLCPPRADLDPIYFCELLKTCPINDHGDATIKDLSITPVTGPQGINTVCVRVCVCVEGVGGLLVCVPVAGEAATERTDC